MTKAAIVTGSATGIGAAIARSLASRGWGVVINYTRSETARRTVTGQLVVVDSGEHMAGGIAPDDG